MPLSPDAEILQQRKAAPVCLRAGVTLCPNAVNRRADPERPHFHHELEIPRAPDFALVPIFRVLY